jgi:hypothetical protein
LAVKKIPLGATIDGAYMFFFRNIVSIIGTVWFPAVVFVAVVGGLVLAMVPLDWLNGHFVQPGDVESFIVSRTGTLLVAVPVISLVGLLTGAMTKVGILERAVGNRTGLTLFYFSLGGPVWRMIGAEIVTAIAVIVLAVAGIIVGVALHFAVSAIPNIPLAAVVLFDILQAIGLIVAVVYVSVRLFFFLPAVVVVENRIGLGRSWSLGGGNVGLAIIVFLAVVLPISFVVGTVSNFVTMPIMFAHMTNLGDHPSPAETLALLKAMLPLLPVMIGFQLISSLVITGTYLGAVGKAYREVTG